VGWRESLLKTKVVLVCQSNTVLDLGILSVLSEAHGWMMIQIVPDNIAKLLKAVEMCHPEVVILSNRSYSAQHSLFRNLLTNLPSVRILTVCTESNHVCVNLNQIVRIEKASDLINLIQTILQLRLTGGKMTIEQVQEQRKQLSNLNLKANSKEENL
jgi:hypothetical protein